MSNFSFFDYEDSDISEAVKAVTGDDVIYTSIDEEHIFWYTLVDGVVDEDDIGVDSIVDLYSPEVLEEIQAYLEANYPTN
jgi:predicted transcriptional regulator